MADLKQILINIVDKYDIKCIGIFGSRARGDFQDYSDYDIFMISDMTLDEELKIEGLLEEELGNTVDLINLKEDMDRILLKNILNDGIVFYNKDNSYEKLYKFVEDFFIENSDFIRVRERDLID